MNIKIFDIPCQKIAKLYEIHRSTVFRIKTNRAWKHLEEQKQQ